TSSAPCRSNGKRPTEGQASDGALRLSGFGESTSVVFTSGQALTALRLLTFTRQDFAEAREPKPDYLVPAIRSLSSHSSRPTHLAAQYSSCYAPTAMIFRMRVPRAPLSQFVENLWFYQDLEVNYTKEKLLPDAAVEMIVDLGRALPHWRCRAILQFSDFRSDRQCGGTGLDLETRNCFPAGAVDRGDRRRRQVRFAGSLSRRQSASPAGTGQDHLSRAGNAPLVASNPSARTCLSPWRQP